MFGSTRPSETLHIFGESRLREANPINVVAVRLRETNPNKFIETTLRGRKPRSKFIWVHKAE